jgi:hypothetical protein
MKTTITFASLLPVLLLTSCVAMVPLPPTYNQTYGRVIEKSQTRFIVAGQTTRDEVIAGLGGEFRDSPRVAALAYPWEKPAADLAWWGGGMMGGGGGHFERSHWRAFFVAFDAGGKACRTEFVSLSQRKSLDEQLEDWAERHGATSNINNIARNSK